MPITESISANIPKELGDMLTKVAIAEERSKSYYIKKGLEKILQERLQDLEDYQDAKQAHDDFISSGEKCVSFEDIKKELGS
jgi:predicted DNA-binding protein